jgi:hypothetical protein
VATSPGLGTRAHRPGSVPMGPLLLIGLGVLLLAANVGWLSWSDLLRVGYLAPVAAIAFGIDILLGGKYRLPLVLATLVVAAWLLAGQAGALGFVGLGPATATPEPVSQDLMGAARAEVTLRTGVAELRVVGGVGSGLLAEGTIRPVRGVRVERTFSLEGGVARFTLESEGRVVGFAQPRAGLWELALTGAVPIALTVDTGVGEALLDLTQVRLSRLQLDTGVGESTVILPPTGGYEARVNTGVGAATVRLPAGLPVRITVSRGLGGVSIPADFERDGDVYTTAGFAAAAERVELRVSSGVGQIAVERVD